jgi:hypothetical protein
VTRTLLELGLLDTISEELNDVVELEVDADEETKALDELTVEDTTELRVEEVTVEDSAELEWLDELDESKALELEDECTELEELEVEVDKDEELELCRLEMEEDVNTELDEDDELLLVDDIDAELDLELLVVLGVDFDELEDDLDEVSETEVLVEVEDLNDVEESFDEVVLLVDRVVGRLTRVLEAGQMLSSGTITQPEARVGPIQFPIK